MNLADRIEIPKACRVETRITKKVVLEEAQPKAPEKRILRESVQSMQWLAAIKPDNSVIPKYQDEERVYDEVHHITISITKASHSSPAGEMLQKFIPYPVVVWVFYEGGFRVYLAEKRRNKANPGQSTILAHYQGPSLKEGDSLTESFLDEMRFSRLDHKNLLAFYQSMQARVVGAEKTEYTGGRHLEIANEPAEEQRVLQRIKEVEDEIGSLRSKLKRESRYSEKVVMNMRIQSLRDEVKKMKEYL